MMIRGTSILDARGPLTRPCSALQQGFGRSLVGGNVGVRLDADQGVKTELQVGVPPSSVWRVGRGGAPRAAPVEPRLVREGGVRVRHKLLEDGLVNVLDGQPRCAVPALRAVRRAQGEVLRASGSRLGPPRMSAGCGQTAVAADRQDQIGRSDRRIAPRMLLGLGGCPPGGLVLGLVHGRGRGGLDREARGGPAAHQGPRRGGERGRPGARHGALPRRPIARMQSHHVLLVTQRLGGLDPHEVHRTKDLDGTVPHRLVCLAVAVVRGVLEVDRVPGGKLPCGIDLPGLAERRHA
mmetsp:Transcript_70224/g.184073  ORF Transcript_70224/g.184073 Transcript_70224/m.184073 type:complete len:294 (-) Transcript_70224:642-1523(-)